ncbi:MAG: rRNA maturation RNase YbeY [Anaerolineae bacterium]|nr:rRNA maturation RNase YbeY [Anaerolineae bacterium]
MRRLKQAAAWVLDRHSVSPEAGLSIVIADDETVRQLNRQYRQVDAPTDVLSFPAGEAGELPDDEPPYLGDLILGLPTIQRQAEREGHSVSDELALAVVHGALHLLGYDHDTPARQAAMWAVQAEALLALDINIRVPEFEFPTDIAPDSGHGEPL